MVDGEQDRMKKWICGFRSLHGAFAEARSEQVDLRRIRRRSKNGALRSKDGESRGVCVTRKGKQ